MSNMTTTLASGRRVGVSAFGDPMADRIAVICHPSPGSSGFDPDPVLTERWGLRIVALDRPGYAGSEPLTADEHPTLFQRADDVAAFIAADERNADRISHADLQRLGVIGWGTGAIVAAALAVRHPELVDRLALISPPAPAKARASAGRTLAAQDGLATLQIAEDDPGLARHLGLDRRLERMIQASFEQGDAGLIGDRRLLEDDEWVDGLRGLDTPVLVVVGAQDPTVGGDDIDWWRRHLPESADFRTIDGSASLTVADAWQQVLAHIAPAHGHIQEEYRDHGDPRLPEVPPRP